jgi:hypothetical protein
MLNNFFSFKYFNFKKLHINIIFFLCDINFFLIFFIWNIKTLIFLKNISVLTQVNPYKPWPRSLAR